MEPVEPDFIIRLRVARDAGQALPDEVVQEVVQRVLSAFDKYRLKKTIRFSQAFELGKRGHSPEHQRKLAERNRHLQVAFDNVCLTPLRDWPRAGRLLEALNRFESVTWSRIKDLDVPPDRFNEVQKALFYAKKTGAYIPASQGGLLNILQMK